MQQRMLVEVRGIVQGVGFRPWVYGQARALDLRGFVQNRGSHLYVDVEGDASAIDAFLERLASSPPALASIDAVESQPAAVVHRDEFAILRSDGWDDQDVRVAPDVATCPGCLDELWDPSNRRFRYPFITCTDCGPRFTIVETVPYDRRRITMAAFAMCPACQREYHDPRDRRFHAEAIACPECGPTLFGRGPGHSVLLGGDALAAATRALLDGRIVAIKGIGGYHLACDATSDGAVSTLRRRKRRDEKPFAVMLPDVRSICERVSGEELAALRSHQRPIVLVDRQAFVGPPASLSANIAPGCPSFGVMLPYTPLHHLLLHDAGRPLVMTSGNASDEPIAFEDEDACRRLGQIADLILFHDRRIQTRCDDSVLRIVCGAPALIRRSRGYAPLPMELREQAPAPVLAVGGHLKNTVCLFDGARAYLSHHIGDLDNLSAYLALREAVTHYSELLNIRPEIVAHDLHPDYLSTRFAHEVHAARRLPVQHHHAHVLACAGEHGVTEPVLGVAFDGAGLGDDGAVWGGEFLLIHGSGYSRLAHLAYVPMPGGDAAAREPWRMAVAHLAAAGSEVAAFLPLFAADIPAPTVAGVCQLVSRGGLRTSSVGRLFDAAAALIGLRYRNAFEGQAAMELEWLAASSGCQSRRYGFELSRSSEPWTIEAAPVIRELAGDVARGLPGAEIARGFHAAVASMVADVAGSLARRHAVRYVALTGGVFQNRLLTETAAAALSSAGFLTLVHQRVPCSDGGLALGQAIAAARVLGASPI